MKYGSCQRLNVRIRRRPPTKMSFLAAIAIHLIALILVNLKWFPILHQLNPDPPINSEVEVRFVESLLPSDSAGTQHAVTSLSELPSMAVARHDMSLQLMPNINNVPVSLDRIPIIGQAPTAIPTYLKAPAAFDFNLSPPAPVQPNFNSSSEPYPTTVGDEVGKSGSGQSDGSSAGSAGEGQSLTRIGQIGSAMVKISGYIASGSKKKRCDITFLLDTSGSMEDNIEGVEQSLDSIVDVFMKEEIDYLFGMVKFKYDSVVYPQTKNIEKLRNLLKYKMRVGGDEMAYDAIVKAISRIEFRLDSDRYFIVVTDEPFKGNHSYTDVLKLCMKHQIHVNILGVDDPFQKWLTERTGGIWMEIPQ